MLNSMVQAGWPDLQLLISSLLFRTITWFFVITQSHTIIDFEIEKMFAINDHNLCCDYIIIAALIIFLYNHFYYEFIIIR